MSEDLDWFGSEGVSSPFHDDRSPAEQVAYLLEIRREDSSKYSDIVLKSGSNFTDLWGHFAAPAIFAHKLMKVTPIDEDLHVLERYRFNIISILESHNIHEATLDFTHRIPAGWEYSQEQKETLRRPENLTVLVTSSIETRAKGNWERAVDQIRCFLLQRGLGRTSVEVVAQELSRPWHIGRILTPHHVHFAWPSIEKEIMEILNADKLLSKRWTDFNPVTYGWNEDGDQNMPTILIDVESYDLAEQDVICARRKIQDVLKRADLDLMIWFKKHSGWASFD